MATFVYAPTQSVAKQGIFGSAHPLTISVQGFLIPTPITGADITLGGTAVITTNINGATSFCYFPSAVHTINTHGDALITATQSGVLCVDYKVPPYGVVLGGAATIIQPSEYAGTGGIVTGGTTPITVTLCGVDQFCYTPSANHAVTLDGDSLVVVSVNGVLCVDYKVAPDGVHTGGAANVTTVINGVTTYCYNPTCGVTMGGEADTEAVLAAGARGGKGTPYYRRRVTQNATHHYYHAEAFFDNTLQVSGEASVLFTPARYAFIKSLPRMPIDWLAKQDSEFKVLYKELQKRGPANTFSYVAEPSNMKFGGEAEEDYFDFTNFIIMHDDDVIIADILSTDGNPFITTTFSQDLARRKRDDDDIIEILELL